MAKISRADFEYYKSKLFKDKDYHGKEFLQRIDPDLIDSYYEGYPSKEHDRYGDIGEYNAIPDRLSLNTIFPSTATLVAQFYPQNPRFIGIARREEDELAAKVAASAMNYYFEQMNAVKENQKAIISALMYGFGVIKQGWRTEFKNPDKK